MPAPFILAQQIIFLAGLKTMEARSSLRRESIQRQMLQVVTVHFAISIKQMALLKYLLTFITIITFQQIAELHLLQSSLEIPDHLSILLIMMITLIYFMEEILPVPISVGTMPVQVEQAPIM